MYVPDVRLTLAGKMGSRRRFWGPWSLRALLENMYHQVLRTNSDMSF